LVLTDAARGHDRERTAVTACACIVWWNCTSAASVGGLGNMLTAHRLLLSFSSLSPAPSHTRKRSPLPPCLPRCFFPPPQEEVWSTDPRVRVAFQARDALGNVQTESAVARLWLLPSPELKAVKNLFPSASCRTSTADGTCVATITVPPEWLAPGLFG